MENIAWESAWESAWEANIAWVEAKYYISLKTTPECYISCSSWAKAIL